MFKYKKLSPFLQYYFLVIVRKTFFIYLTFFVSVSKTNIRNQILFIEYLKNQKLFFIKLNFFLN